MNNTPPQRVGAVSPGILPPGPLLLSLSGAAKRLGVSKYAIKQLAAEGKIKAVECGEHAKYNAASIDAYADGKVPHIVMNQRQRQAQIVAAAKAKAKARRTAA